MLFETVSIWMKGGWQETRGVQRPTSTETPVSESRTASLNPFDTKRKKALSGASSRIRDMQVAEGTGLPSNLLWRIRPIGQRGPIGIDPIGSIPFTRASHW